MTWFSKYTVITSGGFSLINLILRGKYVYVTFFFTLLYPRYHVFSELSLATTIAVLASVSCYYMTSFDYGGKNAMYILLVDAIWAILCLIVYSIIAWDGGWLDLFVFTFEELVIAVFLNIRGDGFSLITITLMGVGKP